MVYHVVDGQKRESRIKKTLQELFSDKRRLAVVCVLICCVIVAVIGGVFLLALQEQNRESASIQEKEQLRSSVSGMREWTVEEGTRQVDYLDEVTWDDSVVEQVTFDDGEVDLSQTGTYELIYLITGVDGIEESCSYRVSVISREEAKEKAEEGSEVVTKDKGIVNRKEVPSSATSGNDTSDASRQDSQESSDAPQTSGGSSSGGGSSDSGSSGGSSDTNQPDEEDRPHVHTWVNVSPADSGFMDYAAECRKYGQNGGEPMFFRSINDFRLHQAADDCHSSWGTGFNGLAYKYCSTCGEQVITGHVHDFGTVAKQVPVETIVCECGMSFTGGQGYTALESWQTHVYYYTGNGYPKEEHDTYQVKQNSVIRYEATKTCSCRWRPVDPRPVY